MNQLKPWDLQNLIKERVNRESELEWASTPEIPIPKYKKCDIIKESAGWYNLISSFLKELRP